MRLLWVTSYVPNSLASGMPVYSVKLATACARAGAEVTFLGLRDPAPVVSRSHLVPEIDWRPVDAAPAGRLAVHTSTLPFVTAHVSPPPMLEAFRKAVDDLRPDYVVADNYAAGWVLDHLPRGRGGPGFVYVSHNFEERLAADIARNHKGALYRKALLTLNALKTRRLERKLVASSDVVVAISNADAAAYRSYAPSKPILVLTPGYEGPALPERTIDASVPRQLIMIGSMHWVAKRMNVARFIEAADGRLAEAGVRLLIVGDAPADFRAQLEQKAKATTFLGFVDDPAPLMQQSRFGLVVEATGGGFKLKLLDYVFARVPVAVIEGSIDGAPEDLLPHVISEPDAAALAERLITAIDDLPLLNRLQRDALEAARYAFDWNIRGRALVEALARSCAAQRRQGLLPKHGGSSLSLGSVGS